MTPTLCDASFERAEKAYNKAKEHLQGAVTECLLQSIQDLARACRCFKDDEASRLRAGILEGLKSFNLLRSREAILAHVATVDRTTFVVTHPTAQAQLAMSAELVGSSIMEWSGCEFDRSYRDTVRARHALETLLKHKA